MTLMSLLVACSATTAGDSGSVDAAPATDTAESGSTDTSDPTDPVAATLGGLRWELPCLEVTAPTLCTTVDTAHTEAVLAGEANRTYAVTLRFRGVIEPKTYTGASAEGPGWTQGGTPAADTANIYALTISEPSSTFYVNAGTTRAASELWAEVMDITLVAPIRAGATVSLDALSLDALQIRNVDENGTPIVIDGVDPAPAAYDGQFIQMDVVGVE